MKLGPFVKWAVASKQLQDEHDFLSFENLGKKSEYLWLFGFFLKRVETLDTPYAWT